MLRNVRVCCLGLVLGFLATVPGWAVETVGEYRATVTARGFDTPPEGQRVEITEVTAWIRLDPGAGVFEFELGEWCNGRAPWNNLEFGTDERTLIYRRSSENDNATVELALVLTPKENGLLHAVFSYLFHDHGVLVSMLAFEGDLLPLVP